MKFYYLFSSFLSIVIYLCFISCNSEDNGDDAFAPTAMSISGKVEKGPFVSGSTITVQPMDENLQVMGSMYSTMINDDLGNFVLGGEVFQTSYAELMANGYFFNEINGELSNGTLTLRALVDLSDKQTVNVNVLTHLKYTRIKNLIANGYSFKQANEQAQEELLKEFGFQKQTIKDASQMSIMEGTGESAILIAVSSLLLIERSEAELTEYLSKLSEDFGQDGYFSEQNKEQMKRDKKLLVNSIDRIQNNIVNRYKSLGVDIRIENLDSYMWESDYAMLKEEERSAINKFISSQKINVISQEQFCSQGFVTDISKNEYVLLEDNGVYMQIVRKGEGEPLADGERAEIYVRYYEVNIKEMDTLTGNLYDASNPDVMTIENKSGSYSGSFTSGYMYSAYGSSVPSGWLIPFSYIHLKFTLSGSPKVRLIIPHSEGQSTASSYVYPCFYEITYQKGR